MQVERADKDLLLVVRTEMNSIFTITDTSLASNVDRVNKIHRSPLPCLGKGEGDCVFIGRDQFDGESKLCLRTIIDIVHINLTNAHASSIGKLQFGLVLIEKGSFTRWNLLGRHGDSGGTVGDRGHLGGTETTVKHITITIISCGFLSGQSFTGSSRHLRDVGSRPRGCFANTTRRSTGGYRSRALGFKTRILQQTQTIRIFRIIETLDQILWRNDISILVVIVGHVGIGLGRLAVFASRSRHLRILLQFSSSSSFVQGSSRHGRTVLDFGRIIVVTTGIDGLTEILNLVTIQVASKVTIKPKRLLCRGTFQAVQQKVGHARLGTRDTLDSSRRLGSSTATAVSSTGKSSVVDHRHHHHHGNKEDFPAACRSRLFSSRHRHLVVVVVVEVVVASRHHHLGFVVVVVVVVSKGKVTLAVLIALERGFGIKGTRLS